MRKQNHRIVVYLLAISSLAVAFTSQANSSACPVAIPPSRGHIGAHFAMPSDMMCMPTEIFIAKILSASLADCRFKDSSDRTCSPKDELRLHIKVGEIVGAKEQELELLHVRAAST